LLDTDLHPNYLLFIRRKKFDKSIVSLPRITDEGLV